MDNLITMGIYCPRSEALPGGLAILTEIKDKTAQFVLVEEAEINQPLNLSQKNVFSIPKDMFINLFEYSGMCEKPVNE